MKFRVSDIVKTKNNEFYTVVSTCIDCSDPNCTYFLIKGNNGETNTANSLNFTLVEEINPTQADLKRGYWTASHIVSPRETSTNLGGVKHDQGKPDLSMIPYEALVQVAQVLGMGAEKYGRSNWQKGISTTRLIAAAMRHIGQFNDGIDVDDESNLSHIAHATANLMFLMWMMKNKPEQDDRK